MLRLSAILVLLSGVALGQATQPADAERVQRLVRATKADDPVVRETAIQHLLALGPAAVPQVREMIRKAPDAATRADLRRLILRLQPPDPESPTLVSLHLDDQPVSAALNELA